MFSSWAVSVWEFSLLHFTTNPLFVFRFWVLFFFSVYALLPFFYFYFYFFYSQGRYFYFTASAYFITQPYLSQKMLFFFSRDNPFLICHQPILFLDTSFFKFFSFPLTMASPFFFAFYITFTLQFKGLNKGRGEKNSSQHETKTD